MGPKRGGASPWGRIQDVRELAEGIAFVSTASHGGFKVDRKRNARVHKALRVATGWYEEDCECAHVMVSFPELFKAEEVARARRSIIDYSPDAYAEWTGEPAPADSRELQERAFKAANAERLVVTAAWGSWHERVPAGKVGVVAVKGGRTRTDAGNGRGRYFLVDEAAYDARGPFGFVVDEATATPVEQPF